MILGDPAVKLRVGVDTSSSEERPAITEIVSHTPAGLADAGAVAPQTQPVSEPVSVTAASASATEIDYGLLDTFRETQASMGAALGQFVDKLGNFLGAALDEATSLEIATYVSEDMSEIEYERGEFKGASLRAFTRIEIDGDTLICVPEQDGVVDTDLWEIHMDMVQQAQTSRAELLKTVVSAATGLVDLIKP
jgi:hypothetical protein